MHYLEGRRNGVMTDIWTSGRNDAWNIAHLLAYTIPGLGLLFYQNALLLMLITPIPSTVVKSHFKRRFENKLV